MNRRVQHWQVIAIGLICFDVIAISFSYFLGLWLRFDFSFRSIPHVYLYRFARFLPIYLVICIVFFWFMRMYRAMWRFIGFSELLRFALASLIASGVHIVLITLIFGRMPISYYVVGTVIQLILLVGVRYTYRFYVEVCKKQGPDIDIPESRVMVIGAGDAGRTVVKNLKTSDKVKISPICIIDDNPNKWGRFIEGVPIAGGREDIPKIATEYNIDQIYFCIPGIEAKEKKAILDICKTTGCELKSLPGIYQLATDEVRVSDLKPVEIEDLLGREPISVDLESIFKHLKGMTILVTGGGGSIGSELCRQIAAHQPKRLIIFDIYENTTYDIERELRAQYPDLTLDVLIGSVRDSRRVNQVFETYRPDIVYHAAAHKHVPMMEFSPNEAIKNNVIGTYKTAYAALKYGTQRFVMISTDKAVNPTNIMGASKRLCEMVIQSMDAISKSGRMDVLPMLHAHQADGEEDALYEGEMEPIDSSDLKIESTKDRGRDSTQFVAVRFGNVLGSNGSVIPIFQKQIEDGGPVTVTDQEITRYFMTIPEAVSLVLQAGTYAWGGEIFVLDMGDPVKIDTLARNLIQLSGLQPDEDIEIVYTGLRPGEKLYEEKLMAEEGLKKTNNKLIYVGKPVPFEVMDFLKQLEELAEASYENSDRIVEMVEEIVTTYHPEQQGTGK